MKKQRDLFEGAREELLRRLLEEVRVLVTKLFADLAIERAGARRKVARDDR